MIMPAHNAAKTVKAAVKSTLNAMGARDRLILGLHNCTDGTHALVANIADPRMHIIFIQGGSLSGVLNSMLALVETKYVARMDADDICMPWRFRIQRRFLDRTEEVDFAFSTAVLLENKSILPKVLPQFPMSLNSTEISYLLSEKATVMHPTLLARTASLRQIGGYRDVIAEDWDMWLRGAAEGLGFHRIGIFTIFYRISEGQYTSLNQKQLAISKDDPDFKLMRKEAKRIAEKSSKEIKLRRWRIEIERHGFVVWLLQILGIK